MTIPNIDRQRFTIPPAGFFKEPQKKDLIVLGCTGGVSAENACQSWRRNGRLRASPYLIDFKGRIFETFDPRAWAFHLNMPASLNPAARNDRRSIAVALVNPGGLRPRPDGKLAWRLNNYTKTWCLPDNSARYTQQTFRGFDFFATFTDAQYDALRTLLPWLCREHGIPWQFAAPADRLSDDVKRWVRFRGILAHHHFRPDHADVGPAFDWDRIRSAQET
jgi:N-acetyl-anhydromuramyl-L-alanine amidase AmpD